MNHTNYRKKANLREKKFTWSWLLVKLASRQYYPYDAVVRLSHQNMPHLAVSKRTSNGKLYASNLLKTLLNLEQPPFMGKKRRGYAQI